MLKLAHMWLKYGSSFFFYNNDLNKIKFYLNNTFFSYFFCAYVKIYIYLLIIYYFMNSNDQFIWNFKIANILETLRNKTKITFFLYLDILVKSRVYFTLIL
jgi:hypothetical protein